MSGWLKAAWLLAMVFVPIIGVVAYFATRPRRPVSELWFQPSSEGIYAQRNETVGLEIQNLAQLRKDGALTDEESNTLKERAISAA
jgi:phospholipase D-like protein